MPLFTPKPRIKSVRGIYIITPRDVEIAARHHLAAFDAEQQLRAESRRRYDPSYAWVLQAEVCHRWSDLMRERMDSGRALMRVIGYRPEWWSVDGRLLRHVYNTRRDHIEVRALSPTGGSVA